MTDLKHAFDCLQTIKKRIEDSNKFFLFLDYDGTLTPIVNNPGDAKPLPGFIKLLEKSKSKKTIISIVSGRDIKDLFKLLEKADTSAINLAGSHGSDIIFSPASGKKNKTRSFSAKEISTIRHLKKSVSLHLCKIPNSRIEEKPYSFAFHYRDTPAEELYKIDEIIDLLKQEQKEHDFKYIIMKKVIEVMPKKQSKGAVIKKIIQSYIASGNNKDSLKYLILCIGDDVTDEDLFAANTSGINIRVQQEAGKIKTLAKYYLKNPEEVIHFLEKILD